MKRLALIKSLILPAWALFGLAWLVVAGFSLDHYASRLGTEPRLYPWTGVLMGWAAVLIETAFVAAVLRPASYNRSWGRALLALVVVLLWSAYLGMGALHQSYYYFAHLYWLGLMLCGLALLFVVSLIRRLFEI